MKYIYICRAIINVYHGLPKRHGVAVRNHQMAVNLVRLVQVAESDVELRRKRVVDVAKNTLLRPGLQLFAEILDQRRKLLGARDPVDRLF